jgi:2-polyprenyl-6-hydroxyphenyl methylase / 3-demethylubiquinone-9 3-methyltransferase
MKKITQEIYECIDNDYYNLEGDKWWQSDSLLYLMKSFINPVRLDYSRKKLLIELNISPQNRTALEVGCGGGMLCEEIAGMGFITTGIDPSEESLRAASNHARLSGLNINYDSGRGEALPYNDKTYNVVFCCDVLEHVRDLPKVISEVSRVLKPEGVFIYDTFNRTLISKLFVIKISQEWKRWAFMPSNLHVWEMFIKPEELKSLLRQNNLEWKEHRGIRPDIPLLKILNYLRKRVNGKLTHKDIVNKVHLVESNSMSTMYMGYAIKKTPGYQSE